MLNVRELSVKYGVTQVLYDVSLSVERGELVTLIGPNGSGKTTLLRCLSGLTQASSGNASFLGRDLLSLSSSDIVKMGLAHVPEGRRVFYNMTVLENLLLGGIRTDKLQRSKNLHKVFDLFPVLAERKNQPGGTLSGGEQSMLVVGRGLMMEPELLIMDEPCLGLAPIVVNSLAEKIGVLVLEGLTILLVEQNAAFALKIAKRGYVLTNGQIVTEGDTAELVQKEDAIKKAYLGG